MSPLNPPSAFSRRQVLGFGLAGTALIAFPSLLSGCSPQPQAVLATGAELANPPMLTPSSGRMSGTVTAKIADVDVGIGRLIRTYTYDGALPGRTWELHPGDTIAIDLRNDLPPLGAEHSGHTASPSATPGADDPLAMTRPHKWTSTNMHTHGLHVSPEGTGDNVFRTIEPGQSGIVEIPIPENHTGGLFWYHPHLHGGVKQQVRGGMAGALIIRGAIDEVPEVKAAQERILVLQDIELDKEFKLSEPNPASTDENYWPEDQDLWIINGQYRPTITMKPGEVQRWRIVNAASGWIVRLQVQGHPVHHLAYDGLTLAAPKQVEQTSIVPGGRCELLIKAGAVGYYDLVLLPSFEAPVVSPTPDANGYIGQSSVARVIATVRVEGEAVDMKLPSTLPEYSPEMLPIARQRTVEYTSHQDSSGNTEWFGIDGKPFDPNTPPYEMQLDTAEQWTVQDDDGGFTHIFHIHINPFLVTEANGVALDPPEWHDTYALGPESFTFTMNLTDFAGKYVHHCHYLDHEDMGMMEAVAVTS